MPKDTALLCAVTIVLAGVMVGCPAYGQQPRSRIAVLQFLPEGVTESEAAAVSDRLRSGFVNLGTFTVLDRQEIETVLAEQAFQQQGLTDPQQAAKVGKLLNVEYIVSGRVRSLQGAYHVNTRMVRVQTGEIVRSEDIIYRGDIVGLLSENMDSVAARLAQAQRGSPGPSVHVASQPSTRSRWALWSGAAALALGVYLQLEAQSAYDDAVAQANRARTSSDPASYASAAAQKDDAVSQQTTAQVIGGIGAALLAYHFFFREPENAPAPGMQSGALAPPIQLRAATRGWALRVTAPW